MAEAKGRRYAYMPDEKIYWYVLFARTGAEERLAGRLRDRLGDKSCLPFVPQKTYVFRRQGKKSLFQRNCFPGYVFFESGKPAAEFMEYAFPIVYKQKEAYRFLCYGDRHDIAIRDEERITLSRVFGEDKQIDISQGFKEGDSVKVISGALFGNEGIIQRINRGRQEVFIGVSMFGTIVSVSVGIEVIEKMPEASLIEGTNDYG
jgi:transcription antitermination factor NusG